MATPTSADPHPPATATTVLPGRRLAETNASARRRAVPRRQRGFTLIELLIVCGIIAILIGLLFPTIRKARESAQTVRCLNNLRQIGMVSHLYYSTSGDGLMPYSWYTPSNPQSSYRNFWIGLLERQVGANSIQLCPVATEPNPGKWVGLRWLAWNGQMQTIGTAVHLDSSTWRIGSYGHNGWLYNTKTPDGRPASDHFGSQIMALRNASLVPMYFDCVWVDTWPTTTDPAPADLTGSLNSNLDRVAMSRHGRGINVCFADESAHWVSVDEIMQLQWTPNWVAQYPTMPAQ